MKLIAGIDYSLTSPAMCVCDADKPFSIENCYFLAVPNNKKLDQYYLNGRIAIFQNPAPTCSSPEERFDKLSQNFENFAIQYNVEHVLIEDYAFAARGRVFHLGENCGLLKHKLYRQNIQIDTIAPPTAKKFATGNGRADKDEIFAAFVVETGINLIDEMGLKHTKKLPSPVDDLIDAYYIAKYLHESINKTQ